MKIKTAKVFILAITLLIVLPVAACTGNRAADDNEKVINGGNMENNSNGNNKLDTNISELEPEDMILTIDFENGQLNGFSPRGDDGRDTSKLTVTTEAARSGNYSLLVTERSFGWNGPSLQVEKYITADKTYSVSFWVLLKSPNSAQLILSTQFKQGGSEQYRNLQSQNISRADGWTELKGQFTYDSSMDLRDVTIYVESANADVEFYIDDISFSELEINKPEIYIPEEGEIVWEASNGVARHAETIEGYDYELWSQNGIGTATIIITSDIDNGGTFKAAWYRTLNILFRSGKKFTNTSGKDINNPSQIGMTHEEIGEIVIDFEAEWSTDDEAAFLSVTGGRFTITKAYRL